MQAELITIGDEILIGQTVDTNSAWMGQKLNEVGVEVHCIHSIRDTSEAIIQTLDGLHADTQLVLITGGLGPTKDDLTKHTLTRYFGGQLRFDQEVFAHIQSLFQQMGRDISHLNRDQAELPSNAFIWKNDVGTASAMRFEHEDRFYISMPGVPYEMKHLMHTAVLPWIAQNFLQQDIVHRTFLTQGIPESVLAEQIREWELGLPKSLKLAYLPSPGIVKLRLTGMGERAALEQQHRRGASKAAKGHWNRDLWRRQGQPAGSGRSVPDQKRMEPFNSGKLYWRLHCPPTHYRLRQFGLLQGRCGGLCQ